MSENNLVNGSQPQPNTKSDNREELRDHLFNTLERVRAERGEEQTSASKVMDKMANAITEMMRELKHQGNDEMADLGARALREHLKLTSHHLLTNDTPAVSGDAQKAERDHQHLATAIRQSAIAANLLEPTDPPLQQPELINLVRSMGVQVADADLARTMAQDLDTKYPETTQAPDFDDEDDEDGPTLG